MACAVLPVGGRPRAFHDFVLAQGLLPHSLLREVVLAHFDSSAPRSNQ